MSSLLCQEHKVEEMEATASANIKLTAGCACFVPVNAILLTACFDVNSFL